MWFPEPKWCFTTSVWSSSSRGSNALDSFPLASGWPWLYAVQATWYLLLVVWCYCLPLGKIAMLSDEICFLLDLPSVELVCSRNCEGRACLVNSPHRSSQRCMTSTQIIFRLSPGEQIKLYNTLRYREPCLLLMQRSPNFPHNIELLMCPSMQRPKLAKGVPMLCQ